MCLRVCFLAQSYEGVRKEDQAERGVELQYSCNTGLKCLHEEEVGVWMGRCSYVPCCCDKMPEKSTSGRERFALIYSVTYWEVMVVGT